MNRTNREKIRGIACDLEVEAKSVLHELDYGDFTEADLVWYMEHVQERSLQLYLLLQNYAQENGETVFDVEQRANV